MAKGKSKGFPARPRTIPREDILLARWLMGDTIPLDADGESARERGEAMLAGIGKALPLPLATVANLLTVDVDRLRSALRDG